MLPQAQKSPSMSYKSRYEAILGLVLRDARVQHGFESLEISIDTANNIRFTPDFVSGLRKGGKQVLFEIHSEFNFNPLFIEKMFFIKRIAPEYYYILISDMSKEEANIRMNSFESNFRKENKIKVANGEKKIDLNACRNLFGWGEEGSIFDFTYSELNLKSALKTLNVSDICDEFWSVPNKKIFEKEHNEYHRFYSAMEVSIHINLHNFKKSIRYE